MQFLQWIKVRKNVLQYLDCVDDDDMFLDEAEEIKPESETPDCASAQEEFEMLQPGPPKKRKQYINISMFSLPLSLDRRVSIL